MQLQEPALGPSCGRSRGQGKIDLSRDHNAGGDTGAGDPGDRAGLPNSAGNVGWPGATVPAGSSRGRVGCSRSVRDSRKDRGRTSPRNPRRGKTTVAIPVPKPLPPRQEWTMAVPLCHAEVGACGSLALTGRAMRNGNPDRCCDRGFHSPPRRL